MLKTKTNNMNKNVRTLVIDKTDITKQSENKKLPELTQTDLRQKSHEAFMTSDLVIGITEGGQTVLLKNRWGDKGVVISQEDYNKFIKPKNENSKLNNSSKKKSFLGGIYPFNFWPFNRS
jgi:hypothetical protein